MEPNHIKLIKPGSSEFLQASALLSSLKLPVSDLERSVVRLWGNSVSDQIVGTIGVEVYGPVMLLRSLAVATAFRGKGLADALCRHVFGYARTQNVGAIYLLTDTAGKYFERRGFLDLDRNDAPNHIKQTSQFSDLCPASARLMCLNL